MSVKQVHLTAEGARVAAYAMNNNIAINFTKFAIGSGENYNPSQATAMTKEDFQAVVTSVQRKGANYWKVRGAFRNDELKADLTFRELGLYVSDPENKGEEVLYCYGNAKGDDFDYTEIIPAFTTSGNVVTRFIDIDAYVKGDKATFYIDDTAKVDIATVQELRDDLEQEVENRQNAINDIIETHATKTETEKVKWLKSIRNNSSNAKYYVVKNIKNDPLQIMGSITRVDTTCSVFNFTVTNCNEKQTRIVGVWNNSAMYGQTWEILPFRVYYQSDGTCNLWVEIPSYSSMKIVLSSYSGTDYNFQESTFDDTGIVCPNEMSITANKLSRTLAIAEGGTGATTSKGAQYQLLNDMEEVTTNAIDDTLFVGAYVGDSTTTGTVYKRKGSTVWEWIKSKISSVLGLTASQYNGNAKTATTASSCSGNSATATTASSCSGNSATATKATQDSAGQQINTTYIKGLSISGKTISYTKGDGTTGTLTTQDTTYTHPTTSGNKHIPSGGANMQVLGYSADGTAQWTGRHDFVYTCTTEADYVEKNVTVKGLTLTTGACIRVLFTKGNTVARPKLNAMGNGIEIVVPNKSNGGVKTLSSTLGTATTGAFNWLANTVLELYYNGSYWVVMNDPIIGEYATSNPNRYGERHISGRKKVWGNLPAAKDATTVTFAYDFGASDTYSLVTGTYKSADNNLGGILVKTKTSVSFTYTTAWYNGTDGNTSGYFIAEGY